MSSYYPRIENLKDSKIKPLNVSGDPHKGHKLKRVGATIKLFCILLSVAGVLNLSILNASQHFLSQQSIMCKTLHRFILICLEMYLQPVISRVKNGWRGCLRSCASVTAMQMMFLLLRYKEVGRAMNV